MALLSEYVFPSVFPTFGVIRMITLLSYYLAFN